MWAFAVDAGEWGELAAARDRSFMATLWAGFAFAEAAVCRMGMVLCAQRACGVFLFADGVVMSEGEAVLAVRCSRSSVEYRDTMSRGEESNSIAQNSGVLWGESDDNRRCCLALTLSGVGGEKPDLPRRDLPCIRKSFRHDFEEDLFVIKGTEVLEEVKWDGVYGAVNARGG